MYVIEYVTRIIHYIIYNYKNDTIINYIILISYVEVIEKVTIHY